MDFSVIICTHNPKRNNLFRALEALQNQSFDKQNWEVVLVDNASLIPISIDDFKNFDFRVNLVREEELGLTKARLRGIKESNASMLVFVDDDNVLQHDYLLNAKMLFDKLPDLGAAGGNSIGEFEVSPPDCLKPYLEMIAVRNIGAEVIGNLYDWDNTPAGAGLIIRKNIADKYAELVVNDSVRVSLDRSGNSLMSSGDIDLVYTSIDLGYKNGLFPQLSFTHIIPANRVLKSYIVRLQKYNVLSNNILEFIRFKKLPAIEPYYMHFRKLVFHLKRLDFFELRMELSRRNGHVKSLKIISELKVRANL